MEAIRIWDEYQMVRQGLTFADLGYLNPDGHVPAWKLDEHKLADTYYRQVQPRKKRK
jgi:hypothetical protein